MRAPFILPADAARSLASGGSVLLDVREDFELRLASVPGALHVPMGQIVARVAELPRDKPIHVLCHSGFRSQQVADWLVGRGFDARNVVGGIDRWAAEVDPSIGTY